jgi:hypothetical protein
VAIIRKVDPIIEVDAFVAGLQRAAHGVVLIAANDSVDVVFRPVSTGWLITDTLVVVPDYVFTSRADRLTPARIRCFGYRIVEPLEADLITNPNVENPGSAPALLRLREPQEGRALIMGNTRISADQKAYLLHHPEGMREVSLSIGRFISSDDTFLRYDANTLAGSGGAPVFSDYWELVGMHVARSTGIVSTFNQGLTIATVLAKLRETPYWGEIARHHNLADVAAAHQQLETRRASPAPSGSDPLLLAAAVRWSVDPATLAPEEAAKLRPLVSDPAAVRWTLRSTERQRLLRTAGSLDALRHARGDEPSDDPGQQVIDRILQGPPYTLAEVEEAALPHWLQAVRWFADVVPELPTPADVNRVLQRRRVRSRLRATSGPDFRGREAELAMLRDWYAQDTPGPMVITGIGGVGKSALIAQFALGLPEETLLLWLDFDRADLAPDDAVSVLEILAEQVAVQLDGFTTPSVGEATWEEDARGFGAAVAAPLAHGAAPLLVLDGFEVAQYVQQHQEIWQVLELILAELPQLRVIVSGRAPVKDLVLAGRPAQARHLHGMAREDAAGWLRAHGITDEAVLARVLDISDGVPLVLQLALRLLEAGGAMQDLPEELPRALVEGFLYQRILDRVLNPALMPVARDALVLRGLTAEMIPAVLGDTLPTGVSAEDAFAGLAREMGLVSAEGGQAGVQLPSLLQSGLGGVLRLRPEVRTATLRLLELNDAARVRLIDERAAAWYAGRDLTQAANVAELVYHRLRLGDIAGAVQVWRDECAPLLLFAEEEFAEDAHAAREWLRARTGDATTPSVPLRVWEQDTAARIRAVIGRGLLRAVPAILAERHGRSEQSPLVLYDAWMHWRSGDLPGAGRVLDEAGAAEGPIARERTVLRALLARQSGDRPLADKLLASIEDESIWKDRERGALDRLAVRAARARLVTNVSAEVELSEILEHERDHSTLVRILNGSVTQSDLVLPALAQRLEYRPPVLGEVMGTPIRLPAELSDLPVFARELTYVRSDRATSSFPGLPPLHGAILGPGPWSASDLDITASQLAQQPGGGPAVLGSPSERLAHGAELGADLAVLGWRRWRLATTSLFLAQVCELILRPTDLVDPLAMAVVATLAAYGGQELDVSSLRGQHGTMNELLDTMVFIVQRAVVPPPPAERIALAAEGLRFEPGAEQLRAAVLEWLKVAAQDEAQSGGSSPPATQLGAILMSVERPVLRRLVLYLLGPDPLEMLFRRIVGFPDTFAL